MNINVAIATCLTVDIQVLFAIVILHIATVYRQISFFFTVYTICVVTVLALNVHFVPQSVYTTLREALRRFFEMWLRYEGVIALSWSVKFVTKHSHH